MIAAYYGFALLSAAGGSNRSSEDLTNNFFLKSFNIKCDNSNSIVSALTALSFDSFSGSSRFTRRRGLFHHRKRKKMRKMSDRRLDEEDTNLITLVDNTLQDINSEWKRILDG